MGGATVISGGGVEIPHFRKVGVQGVQTTAQWGTNQGILAVFYFNCLS